VRVYTGIMIATLSALAEPNRLRIVELLRAGPRAVGDIGDRLRLRQPQVSKHLRVLRDAGLVDVRPVAQVRLYQLRPSPFQELRGWLEEYRQLWDARFDEIGKAIEELKANEQKEKKRHERKRS
jgi:DNA-binding transcriptional ArsR family regulator